MWFKHNYLGLVMHYSIFKTNKTRLNKKWVVATKEAMTSLILLENLEKLKQKSYPMHYL